jgi:hypothetical protein
MLQFTVGLVIAIVAALAFFVGTQKLGFWPMVAAIFRIGLTATSGTRLLGGRIWTVVVQFYVWAYWCAHTLKDAAASRIHCMGVLVQTTMLAHISLADEGARDVKCLRNYLRIGGGFELIFIVLAKFRKKPTKEEIGMTAQRIQKGGAKTISAYWTLLQFGGEIKSETLVAIPREEALKLL